METFYKAGLHWRAMLEYMSGANDTLRGAAFSCQLGIVEQLPPPAILSTFIRPQSGFARAANLRDHSFGIT